MPEIVLTKSATTSRRMRGKETTGGEEAAEEDTEDTTEDTEDTKDTEVPATPAARAARRAMLLFPTTVPPLLHQRPHPRAPTTQAADQATPAARARERTAAIPIGTAPATMDMTAITSLLWQTRAPPTQAVAAIHTC